MDSIETALRGALVAALALLLGGGGFAQTEDAGGGAAESPVGVAWSTDYRGGLERARLEKKPVFMDFFATWCGPCQMMEEVTFQDPAIIQALQHFVCLKIDTDQDRATSFKYRVAGIPRYLVLNHFGEVVGDQTGFVEAGPFGKFLADTLAVSGKKSDGTVIGVSDQPGPPVVPEVIIPAAATAEALLQFLSDAEPATREKAREAVLKRAADLSIRNALLEALRADYLGLRLAAWETLRRIEGGYRTEYDPWAARDARSAAAEAVNLEAAGAHPGQR